MRSATSCMNVAMDRGRFRLIVEMLAAVSVAAGISVVLFLVGYHESLGRAQAAHVHQPSGATIATVWSILFAALAWCRWEALREGSTRGRHAAQWLTALIVLCAIYPVYTNGLRSAPMGFVGNLLTAAVSARTAWRVCKVRWSLMVAPGAVTMWLGYATVLIVDQQRWWW